MRTFVLRARRCSTDGDKLLKQLGTDAHPEIIAHTVANAFYVSLGMRADVEVYVVLESTTDFPKTIRFSSNEGVSFPGFDELSILETLASALRASRNLAFNAENTVQAGVTWMGFGFEALMKRFAGVRPLYLLDPEGEDVRVGNIEANPVFILSDHLAMPKNSSKGLERLGVKTLSVGETMLFASQCVVLLHNEMDRGGIVR